LSQGSDDSVQAYLRNMKRDSFLQNKLECRRIVLEQDEAAENAGRRFEASQSKELQGTTPTEEMWRNEASSISSMTTKKKWGTQPVSVSRRKGDGSSQEMKQMNTQQESKEQHSIHEQQYLSQDSENGCFIILQIQFLSNLAPELLKTPPFQRNVV
jgi:hypothetical protein